MKTFTLHNGNCLDVMKTMESNSVDSIVTDPPYGLSFMGKKWDYDVPSQEIWEEALRVLKPGGYLLAFAGTRTQHRMAVRIEDAGFEIRDMIAWVYGSGFPKSMDVSKAIDKSAGAERNLTPVGNAVKRMIPGADQNATGSWIKDNGREYQPSVSVPATDEAKQWEGWGTALKPALEPITVARKPLEEKTVAANVLKYGTGGINIDDCRVPHMGEKLGGGNNSAEVDRSGKHEGWQRPWMQDTDSVAISAERSLASTARSETLGRFPANFIHDGSEEVVSLFPNAKSGGNVSGKEQSKTGDENANCYGEYGRVPWEGYNDGGSAARFFYCAKTSKKDRNEGMEGMAEHRKAGAEFRPNHTSKADAGETGNPYGRWNTATNFHPTVKPTDLMRYLCRLVTPPNGIVLDPFMGSGSTGKAAVLENFRFVGIELDPNYMKIAEARIESADPTDYEEDPVEKELVGLEKFIE